jgi:hypothetical protein
MDPLPCRFSRIVWQTLFVAITKSTSNKSSLGSHLIPKVTTKPRKIEPRATMLATCLATRRPVQYLLCVHNVLGFQVYSFFICVLFFRMGVGHRSQPKEMQVNYLRFVSENDQHGCSHRVKIALQIYFVFVLGYLWGCVGCPGSPK